MEFKTVDYVNGNDISKLSEDELITMIREERSKRKDLAGLEDTGSTKIKAKLVEHDSNIARLVAILDRRY